MKTLLVSMPFGALERQALGLSLLKPCLRERGLDCDTRYLNFGFAEFIGHDNYVWLSYEAPYTAFAGDWTFTEALYGPRPALDREYVDQVLRGTWRMSELNVRRILRVRSFASLYLDWCMDAVPWSEYGMVGFTSTFEQNIASLALARRLKQRFPRMRIVFGGANWEAEMGLEYHRQFPFIDFVCGGEAEMSFPALVERLAGRKRVDAIPGIVFRRRGESVATGPPERIPSLDQLPKPDYTDYFAALASSTIASSIIPTLLFETSRGCWWGAKNHCTFCGLNGGSMAFRAKSPGRALEELIDLTGRWRIRMVEAVDNILDMGYFQEFLPAVAASQLDLQLFYEVKANLNRKQLRLLRDAGVTRIQPGIESLSDHVLTLMRKGTTGLRNIQLLKWCRDYGIEAEWNMLYGFPGETRDDYRDTLRLLPSIRHLHPPTATGPLRLDRFSPYHNDPERFGLLNVRPLETYRYLYPVDQQSLLRLAYYFDFDYAPDVDPRGYSDEVIAYCEQWKRAPDHGALTAVRRPDGSLGLVDTRQAATRPALILSGLEQAAYEFCDEAHTVPAIFRHLKERFAEVDFTESQVLGFLDSAAANLLMVTDGRYYLSLAQATRPLMREWEAGRDVSHAWSPPVPAAPSPTLVVLGA